MNLQSYINSVPDGGYVGVSEEFILSLGFRKTEETEKYTLYKTELEHRGIEMTFTLMYAKRRQYFVILNDISDSLDDYSVSSNTGKCLTPSDLECFVKSYMTYWIFSISNTDTAAT